MAYLWRVSLGDRLAAIGSLVVIISLFLTWFTGTVSVPAAGIGAVGHNVFIVAHGRTDAVGAGGWRWLILFLAAGIFLYVGARTLPGQNVRLPLPHRQILGLATGVQLGLIVLSLLLPPTIGSWNLSYGAFVGVLGALVAVGGAYLRRHDPEVITEPVAGARVLGSPGQRAERAPRPPRRPRPERRRGRDAVTVVLHEGERTSTEWVPVPDRGTTETPAAPAPSANAPGAAAAPPRRGRAPRRVAEPTQEYGVLGTGETAGGGRAGSSTGRSRPASQPPPAQGSPTGERDPYGPEAPPRRATSRPSDTGSSEVVCAICGTTNTASAKVCRTCGVVLVPRSERS